MNEISFPPLVGELLREGLFESEEQARKFFRWLSRWVDIDELSDEAILAIHWAQDPAPLSDEFLRRLREAFEAWRAGPPRGGGGE